MFMELDKHVVRRNSMHNFNVVRTIKRFIRKYDLLSSYLIVHTEFGNFLTKLEQLNTHTTLDINNGKAYLELEVN